MIALCRFRGGVWAGMPHFIEAIENSGFAIWIRESPSIFAYTGVLSLHAMGLAIIVGLNTVIALRLLGFVKDIPMGALYKLYPWMYVGFTVNALSGLSLLASNASNDLSNWMFYTKLSFILLAMINLELMRARVFYDPGSLTLGAVPPPHARVFATLSIVLWALAICAGRLTEYPFFVAKVLGY
jgi:hypothetical protein